MGKSRRRNRWDDYEDESDSRKRKEHQEHRRDKKMKNALRSGVKDRYVHDEEEAF